MVAAIAAVVGALAPPAQAFEIQNHERITRDALTPLGVDQAAMGQILVGPPPGAGAVGSDAFFADEFRHIDNANNPVDICARTQQAWNFFTPIILAGARPAGPGGTELVDGPALAPRSAAWHMRCRTSTPTPTGSKTTSPSANWTGCHPR